MHSSHNHDKSRLLLLLIIIIIIIVIVKLYLCCFTFHDKTTRCFDKMNSINMIPGFISNFESSIMKFSHQGKHIDW